MATDWGKYIPVKIGKIIAVILGVLLILIIIIGLTTKKHIKIAFLEFNGEREIVRVKDTVTIKKTDTLSLPIVTPQVKENIVPKESGKIEQKNTNGKNEVNQNNGVNNGIQGGENNQQYNYGIIPRKITEDVVMPIINEVPRDFKVTFVCFGQADAETNSCRNQLTSILSKNGFKDINKDFFIRIGTEMPDKIEFVIYKEKKILEVDIPPAKL